MTIRRIGVTGTDLEGLILTDAKGRKLSVDSVRVDYVPHFPWTDPRVLDIRNITISGAQLAIRHDKSGLTVDGLDLEQLRQGAAAFGKRESGEGTMISLPLKGNATGPMVVLEKITLKSVRVLADIGGRRVLLPVDATLTSENNAWKRISAELHLIPRGQVMRISAAIDLDRKLVNVKGDSRLQLEAVSDLLGFRASGNADLKFDTALTLAGGRYAGRRRCGGDAQLSGGGITGQLRPAGTDSAEIQCAVRHGEPGAASAGWKAPAR